MAPPQEHVKFILGTHTIGDKAAAPGLIHFDTPEEINGLLDAFHARGYREIDTGRNYGACEQRLGSVSAPSRFTVHTKIKSMGPGDLEPAKITESIDGSLKDLKIPRAETMFFHVPDRQTPLEDSLKALNDAHRQGKFKHFGLSNYTAAEVQQVLDICEKNGYVKPSVFQGHYNAIVRGGETELFPLLRRHGISFWAYRYALISASGLTTDEEMFEANGSARVVQQQAASFRATLVTQLDGTTNLYKSPAVRDSVFLVGKAVEKHGIAGHAAAIRWTAYHGVLDPMLGDGICFGVSKVAQMQSTLDALEEGPLPQDLAEAMGRIYESLGGSGPGYHL